MKDRVPVYPGRVKLTPVSGQSNTYDMVRADAPTEEGTPLNTNTLLKGTTAELLGLIAEDSTPDDALNALYELATEGEISEDRLPTIPINKGGTGATTAEDARENLGTNNAENITAGTLNSSRLPTVPVSKGGTGATTAEQALKNLGIPWATDWKFCTGDFMELIEPYCTSGRSYFVIIQISGSATNVGELRKYGLVYLITNGSDRHWLSSGNMYNTYIQGFNVLDTYNANGWTWRRNLTNILTSNDYGTSLPAAGTPGRIFFLKA